MLFIDIFPLNEQRSNITSHFQPLHKHTHTHSPYVCNCNCADRFGMQIRCDANRGRCWCVIHLIFVRTACRYLFIKRFVGVVTLDNNVKTHLTTCLVCTAYTFWWRGHENVCCLERIQFLGAYPLELNLRINRHDDDGAQILRFARPAGFLRGDMRFVRLTH